MQAEKIDLTSGMLKEAKQKLENEKGKEEIKNLPFLSILEWK